jgi:hypothetical protein
VVIEDPKSRDDEYRAPRDRVRLLKLAARRFVMIDGSGPPGDEVFQARMPGLYGTAYGLRFALKRRGVQGRVAPLEGLWWTVDGAVADSLRIEWFDEGTVAQIMHVGPYAEERQTIERLHAGIEAAGMRPRGRHHEIYLGDPRRAAPHRLRTILRQPIEHAPPT